MKNKDIKLFNKTIHEVKQVITEITEQRKRYDLEVKSLIKEILTKRKSHNKAVKKQIKELLEIINELYELFDDLSNNGR